MKNKVCYIINFYLGERRKTINHFKVDKLYFLKKQIETLYQIPHSLSKIVFNFNIRQEDYILVSDIFKYTPKYIQGTEVEICFRENYGMSYGAWSDSFDKNIDKFEYFVFNEDDYFFVEKNWDSYLINKFNSYKDCGYLCMVVREPDDWNDYKKHAGHAVGISSNKVLKKVKEKYGCLPHSKKTDYGSNEREGQINQSFCLLELGYNIYDVRDDYRISFAATDGDVNIDIYRFFWWNNKYLINPAILMENNFYQWYMRTDGEHLEEYKPTTREQALDCYNKNIKFYEREI